MEEAPPKVGLKVPARQSWQQAVLLAQVLYFPEAQVVQDKAPPML